MGDIDMTLFQKIPSSAPTPTLTTTTTTPTPTPTTTALSPTNISTIRSCSYCYIPQLTTAATATVIGFMGSTRRPIVQFLSSIPDNICDVSSSSSSSSSSSKLTD